MVITKIEQQKNNKNRYSLYIDGEFKLGISEDVIVFLNLSVKQEINDTLYEMILQKELYAKAKSSALKYLQKQMKSKKEVIQKLMILEYPQVIIDEVMLFLEEYNFVDDLAYAKAYIHDKLSLSKHSMKRIQYDLNQKGIKQQIIEEALFDIDDQILLYEQENLVNDLRKKKKDYECKNKYNDYEIKQKLMYFFSQKGYSFDKIKKAIEIVENSEV
ncbi:MAG: RecX family transcriptional regulator [Clostridia bacterium]|nr:RecX family transcriptional regulator [Clostridia bacterium]